MTRVHLYYDMMTCAQNQSSKFNVKSILKKMPGVKKWTNERTNEPIFICQQYDN